MTVQEIDFLPEQYKVSRRRRYAHYYRLAAVGIVIVIIAGSSYGVEMQKRHVRAQLRTVNMQSDAAAVHMAKLNALEETCDRLGRKATLVKLLECEPRVSPLLAEVADRTPPGTAITRLSLVKRSDSSKLPTGKLRRRRGRDRKKGSPEAIDDLSLVRRRLGTQRIEVEIQGVAVGNLQVVNYVSRLDACKLISRAELVFVSPDKGGHATSAGFRIRCESAWPLAWAADGLRKRDGS